MVRHRSQNTFIFAFVKEDPKEAMYEELISQVGKRALKMIFTIKQH